MAVFIIAEAGVNHNGNINLAKKLIDVAVDAKVNAVKFQTFSADLSISKNTQKALYQKLETNEDETQYDMVKKLELSYDEFRELKKYCDQKNIIFLSTPDEIESADMLYELQDIFKIGSAEINNLPLLRHIGRFQKKVILSTGMSTMSEINDAINILISAGTLKTNITVLHTHTEYPTMLEDVHLNAMLTIKDKFNIDIGYSDHTLGIEIPIAAVAMGAKVIEKHFTLDKSMDGPDHRASLDPKELSQMVQSIRNIEKALGGDLKVPSQREIQNINVCRKSIVAKKNINKGEILSVDNITIKKPGIGISPMKWDVIIGSIATKDYSEDDLI